MEQSAAPATLNLPTAQTAVEMPSAQYEPAAQGVHNAPTGRVPGAQRAFSAPLVAGQMKPAGLREHMHIRFVRQTLSMNAT